jgi:hypothetical protein
MSRRHRACPSDLEYAASRKNNRGGRDKPGHDMPTKWINMTETGAQGYSEQ